MIPITGEANNIKIIKLLFGINHSPNRIEKDDQSINKIKQASPADIISFLYTRGNERRVFSKVVFN